MAGFSNASPLAGKVYRPVPDRASAPSPFRVDEGYSEDPRSQADSENEGDADMISLETVNTVAARESAAMQWLLSQPVETRTGQSRQKPHVGNGY